MGVKIDDHQIGPRRLVSESDLMKKLWDTDLHRWTQIYTNRLAAEFLPDIQKCLLAMGPFSPKAKQTFFLIRVHLYY
jgi:hypothetical protein